VSEAPAFRTADATTHAMARTSVRATVLCPHLEPVGHFILGKPEELPQLTQRQLFGGEFSSTNPDCMLFIGRQFVDRLGKSLNEVPPSFSRVR